jgi:rubrerythrin
VKARFRTRFRRQLLLTGITLPAIWAATLDSPEGHSFVEITALTVVFVAVILTFVNWRCPRCNRYLFRRIYPSACPRCGVTFHD